MSVLTPEERKCVVVLGSGSAGHRTLVATIDRLVAEVERLRARNEALERVAKAANRHIDHGTTNARFELEAALSALNPSDPNSSGGET